VGIPKPCALRYVGSSQVRSLLPSDQDVTLGEKLPLGAGDLISRRLRVVRDSARFEWQPPIKQPKEIDANIFKIVLEFIRMVFFNECRGSTLVGWGSPKAAATATRYRQ